MMALDGIKQRGPYRTRTVTQMTGFAPPLLRSWERRYDLLQPLRGAGGHRLYTEQDLKVLLTTKELLSAGRSIGEIAGFGREALLEEDARVAESGPTSDEPSAPDDDSTEGVEVRPGRAQSVVRAAVAIDAPGLNRVLDEAFAATSVDNVITEVILPVTPQLRAMWMDGKCSAAGENMANGIFCHRVRKLAEAAEPSHSEWAPVVVACFPDEHQQLGALISAFWLARAGFRVTYLGTSIPLDDLTTAWDTLHPAGTVLSVTKKARYDIRRSAFRQLLSRAPDGMPLFVQGEGAPENDPGAEDAGARMISSNTPIEKAMTHMIDTIRERGRRVTD